MYRCFEFRQTDCTVGPSSFLDRSVGGRDVICGLRLRRGLAAAPFALDFFGAVYVTNLSRLARCAIGGAFSIGQSKGRMSDEVEGRLGGDLRLGVMDGQLPLPFLS